MQTNYVMPLQAEELVYQVPRKNTFQMDNKVFESDVMCDSEFNDISDHTFNALESPRCKIPLNL